MQGQYRFHLYLHQELNSNSEQLQSRQRLESVGPVSRLSGVHRTGLNIGRVGRNKIQVF